MFLTLVITVAKRIARTEMHQSATPGVTLTCESDRVVSQIRIKGCSLLRGLWGWLRIHRGFSPTRFELECCSSISSRACPPVDAVTKRNPALCERRRFTQVISGQHDAGFILPMRVWRTQSQVDRVFAIHNGESTSTRLTSASSRCTLRKSLG